MAKTMKLAMKLLAVLLLPLSIFWILWRFGWTRIIDVFAIAVLLAALAWLIFKFLIKQKVFSFKKVKK